MSAIRWRAIAAFAVASLVAVGPTTAAEQPADAAPASGGAVAAANDLATPTPATSTTVAATPTCPPTSPPPRVVGVSVTHNVDSPQTGTLAQLGDTVWLELANAATLAAELDCRARASEPVALALFLDGRPQTGVQSYPPADLSTGRIGFPLLRTADNRALWSQLLGRPGLGRRTVAVSVGLADRFALPSRVTIALCPLSPWPFAFWLLLFAGLLAGFSKLSRHSELLRDPGPPPTAGTRRPFSLSRVQAAWWFFLVLASYLFIGVVTGDFSGSLTGTVLVLLGISAGTTMGSAAVDAGKQTPGDAATRQAAAAQAAARLSALGAQVAAAQQALAATPVDDAARGARASELAGKVATRGQLESQLATLDNRSQGFLTDILSDAEGVCFHRFQSAAWNLVLGFVFVFAVWRDLAMPQFSETLLGLMGISAGTYLGLKLPEASIPQPPPE